jgi:hypothetical protein
MKKISHFAMIVATATLSLGVNAQDLMHDGQTREAVYQEMAAYEAAGFNPARPNPRTWVDDLQSASAKVQAQDRLAKLEAHQNSAYCNRLN